MFNSENWYNMNIRSFTITDGSTHDIEVLENNFLNGIKGWLIGDKGYISKKKTSELREQGIFLITKSRKNMKKYPATSLFNMLMAQRKKVESVLSSLKHRLLIINRYARSPESYFARVFSVIISYTLKKSQKAIASGLFQQFLIS